jgi:hypothetical protein
MDYVIPFLAGGIVVSAFAILGDLLRPKSARPLWCGAFSRPGHAHARFLEGRTCLRRDGRTLDDARCPFAHALQHRCLPFDGPHARFGPDGSACALVVWLASAFLAKQLLLKAA